MSWAIIITTYGERHWEQMALSRALPSAEAQHPDEILQEHFDGLSIAQARNALAAKAKSDWLIFLDADDELASGYLEGMKRTVRTLTFYEGKRIILVPRVSYVRRGQPQPPRFLRGPKTLRDDNFIVVGAGIQRWEFEAVGGFSDYPHGFEDWSLWAKAWKAGSQLYEVPRSVYIAHINEQSEHRQRWKDRNWQVSMHEKVRGELFPELYV